MRSWLPRLAGVLLAAVATAAPAAPPKVIRIAVPDVGAAGTPSSGSAAIDKLHAERLLEQEFARDGIAVEWAFFKGAGPAVNEALVNGQVDFAFLGDLGAIIGRASGSDTRLLAASGRGVHTYLGVVPGRGYTSLASLKGRQVAVWRGTALQLSFDDVLRQEGLSERDFRVVSMDLNAATSALAARRVDAVWGAMNILALQGRGAAEVPVSSRGRSGGTGTLQSGLIARSAFLQASPELATRLLTVYVRAAQWASLPANRDAALALVARRAGYPPALLGASLQGVDLADYYSPLLDPYYLGRFRNGVQAAAQSRLIRTSFDVDAWADPRYLRQALQRAGLQDRWRPSAAPAVRSTAAR